MLLALVIDYSSSFNTCNVAELSSNRTGGNGVQNTTENEKFTVMYSRSPKKTSSLVISGCSLVEFGEEMY